MLHLFLASSGVNEQADFQCPTNWVPFDQQCYFISPESVTEPDSETACADAGTNGLLSSIHNEAERSYIEQLYAPILIQSSPFTYSFKQMIC